MNNFELIRIENEGKKHLLNVNSIFRVEYSLVKTNLGPKYAIEIYGLYSSRPDYRFYDPIATDLWNYLKTREVKVFTSQSDNSEDLNNFSHSTSEHL